MVGCLSRKVYRGRIFYALFFLLTTVQPAICSESESVQIVQQEVDSTEARQEQEPLCAIYFQNPSLHSSRSTVHFGVIVILWPNGEIYWSKNMETGGPPYQKGIVEREKLCEYMKAVNSIKGLDKQKIRENKYLLFDVSYISIALSGNPPLVMQSWFHGLHEESANFVRNRTRPDAIKRSKSQEGS